MELFPEIGLELLKFDRARCMISFILFYLLFLFYFVLFLTCSFAVSQWRVTENRRAFFENFAKKRNFDPLIPSNWYLVSYDEVVSEKVVLVTLHLLFFRPYLYLILPFLSISRVEAL